MGGCLPALSEEEELVCGLVFVVVDRKKSVLTFCAVPLLVQAVLTDCMLLFLCESVEESLSGEWA